MPNDKIIFLYNKCDRKPKQYLPNKHPKVEAFFNNIQNQYPNIFAKYTRQGIASFFFGKYDFQQVCFSSGTFTRTADKKEIWIPGKDFYCQDLWNLIS